MANADNLISTSGIANSTSIISRLPDETLEAIFICGARDHHSKDGGLLIPTPPSWVNVSYVCRHWRNVALNRPTLWTYLFITSPRWTEELLSRSKQAPLRLHVYASAWYIGSPYDLYVESPGLHFLEQVMNHLERIEELCLEAVDLRSEHHNQVFSKLFSRAPQLKTLKISTEIPSNWKWPSVLFDGDAPALRTLDFSLCPLPWYSLNLSGLTTLSLGCLPVRFQQNIVEFLATLRCMQALRHLSIQYVLLSAAGFLSSSAFHTFQKIDIPYLSRLWIAAPLSTVITLLSCVAVPLKTEVRLECVLENGPFPAHYPLLSSLLAQRLKTSDDPGPNTPAIRSLVMEFRRPMATLTFNASEHDYDFFSIPRIPWGFNVPLQVTIDFGESTLRRSSARIPVISNIFCSIPLPNVQILHVAFPPSSSAFWSKILGHLHDLRFLKLSQGRLPDLVSILSLTPHSHDHMAEDRDTERGPDQVLAPYLEELELHDITLSTSRRNRNLSTNVQLLYDALASRRESRGQLRMVQCVIAGYYDRIELDMVGQWEGGHFRVVEESRSGEESLRFDPGSDSESLHESSISRSEFDSSSDSM